MEVNFREQICQTFILVAKNKSLRAVFFQRDLLHTLFTHALKIIPESKKPKPGIQIALIATTVKLLCTVCTIKRNQFYIPGETNLTERLRKRSFDSGLLSLLQHIHSELKSAWGQEPFEQTRQCIHETILKVADIHDLTYQAKVVDLLERRQSSPTESDPELKAGSNKYLLVDPPQSPTGFKSIVSFTAKATNETLPSIKNTTSI